MLRVAILTAALCAMAAPALAEDVRIDCPLREARAEITSPLPSGWWQTPQVGRLSETDIRDIGGKRTLMCGYDVYGVTAYVMMEKPRDLGRCRPERRGFVCEDRGRRGDGGRGDGGRGDDRGDRARTRSTGELDLQQTYMVDFDSGRIASGRDADLWFEAETARQRYLTPRNGAEISIFGRSAASLEDCRRAGFSDRRIRLEDAPAGTYVCVHTSDGRFAQFRVNREAGRSPGTLRIGYTTWDNR